MARAGILYSQVARVAATLAADGSVPTVDAVRAALGHTGSKSTIAPMLKQWKAERVGASAAAGAGLPFELLEAVKTVHQRLQEEAEVDIARMRTELELVRNESAQLLESERGIVRQLQGERDALAMELAQLDNALAQAREGLQQAAVRLAAQQAEIEGMTHRLTDRVAEVSLLASQLAQARQQFDHYQDSAAAQRQSDRMAFESRIAYLERELGGARSAQQEAREVLSSARWERTRCEERLVEVSNTVANQTAQLAEAADALTDARTMAMARHHAAEIAELRLADARNEILKGDAAYDLLVKELALLRGLWTSFLPAPRPAATV